MAINFIDIIKQITNPKSDIIRIIIEYGEIEQKIKNTESQTWYFNQGLESKKARLIGLETEFEKIRKDFNDSSLDELIYKLNEIKVQKENLLNRNLNTVHQIYLSSLISEIKYIEDLIEMKSRVDKIMSINYYTENASEFLLISGWEY